MIINFHLLEKFHYPMINCLHLGFTNQLPSNKTNKSKCVSQKDNTCAMKRSIQHFATKKMCHVTKVCIHDVWPSISFKPSSIMVGFFCHPTSFSSPPISSWLCNHVSIQCKTRCLHGTMDPKKITNYSFQYKQNMNFLET
jgi:hypothetical protein